ncbi:uncharacterized protein LOC131254869 isoform X2 [Magnolia sinica]|uniref:uncharacterized protein LOC131254869 isoform X2 n=1 Tax=Magnolia sinica TaxID=86752 RepID=UPI002659F227|nr:uncharacterized protein LOC131254869 isoform X2 [Magnolia sinica]
MFRVYNFREPVYQEPRAAGVSYDSCLRFLPEVEDPRKEEPSLLYPFLKEKNQEHGYPLSRSPIFYLNPPSIESQSISVRSPTSFSFESRFSHAISCRKMSCEFETAPPTLRIVTISYSELQVPGFPLLRQILLHLSPRLASLPEEAKKELEDPDSRYGFGWSHGKQMLEAGKLDMLKGSFFANPVLDTPTTEDFLIQRYPSSCRPNIWPSNALPKLEEAFKALGKLMLDVGLMLAYHCDRYVTKGDQSCNDESLKQILLRSRCHKARLLYYFPAPQSDCTQDLGTMSSWCGWHTDFGSLTGLTCGKFTRDGVEIACPDSAAGLYIRTRTDQIVKVIFGEDEIAYQIGETTEILSRGRLCATPHCVRAPKGEKALGVERSTFALFMQPDWDENLHFPTEVHRHQELIPPNGTLTFGEYSEILLSKYYG